MDEKLKTTIDKILKLCTQNPEFDKELRRRMQIENSPRNNSNDDSVSNDVHFIREALGIKADNSISYDFILNKGNQRLRDQLLIDNLRMENAALNLKDKEQERFYVFCVNAFYQIENVVNFYLHVKYPKITDLLKSIEKATSDDGKYAFIVNPKKEYLNVGDIEITFKLSAICNSLFPEDRIKMTFSQLRQVRNEGAHRCMIIIEEHDENNALYKFFKYNTFNSIRIALKRLVTAIKDDLDSM